jgi:hypothetical protein
MRTIHKIKNGADNVYLNVSMVHDTNDGLNPSSSTYTANKTQPLIMDPEEYYMAIVQFSIPLDQVPILICPVLTTNGNINTTPMTIGIRDFSVTPNVYFQQNLIWTPELTYENPVTQQGSNAQTVTPYHYMYCYETLIIMMNTALNLAFTAYNATNPGNPHSTFQCPYFVYDPATSLISFIAHNSWITASPMITQGIYMNNDTYNFLDALPSKVYSRVGDSSNYDNVLTIINTGINGFGSAVVYPALPTYIRMTQDYDTMFLWTSLRKIVITSGSLPIKFEQAPIFNNTNPDQFNSLPIVADFIPANSRAGDTREIAYYTSTFYRLIDLTSNSPLQKIQFEIFWLDKQNILYPLKISSFQECTLKVVFTKKSLYNNDY